MSTQKINPTRALTVSYSGDVLVPYPNLLTSGSSSDGSDVILIDPLADFISDGVMEGDIVYAYGTLNPPAYVAKVIDANTIELSIPRVEFGAYQIYGGPNNGGSSDGCSLYIGTGGDLLVVLASGNGVELKNIPDGVFLPLSVLYVASGTCNQIIALW